MNNLNSRLFTTKVPQEPTEAGKILITNFQNWGIPMHAVALALALIEASGGDYQRKIDEQTMVAHLQTILEKSGGTVMKFKPKGNPTIN